MKNSDGGDAPSHSLPQSSANEVGTDALCLSDLSDRDKPWDKHRGNSDKVANHYRGTQEFDKYSQRIDFCSQLLDFRLVPDDREYTYQPH